MSSSGSAAPRRRRRATDAAETLLVNWPARCPNLQSIRQQLTHRRATHLQLPIAHGPPHKLTARRMAAIAAPPPPQQLVPASQHPVAPPFAKKFKASRAREILGAALRSKLAGAVYNADSASAWSRELADEMKEQLKAEDWPLYKYAVQVTIGEQRGEGCRMACRCFLDEQTDGYATESFQNESIFAVAAAFAAYAY